MKKLLIVFLSISFVCNFYAQEIVKIHNLGWSSILLEYNGISIYIDPTSRHADFSDLPNADFLFVTHEHGDHYETSVLNKLTKASTVLVTTETVKNKGGYSGTVEVMANGDSTDYSIFKVKAIPAYNIEKQYHPKGVGNGYLFYFGDKRIYVAGDTEDIPEMKSTGADIAFIPMNLPYTMTLEQAEKAANMIHPSVLYVYHFGNSDTSKFRTDMQKYDSIEIRMGKSVYEYNLETGESKKIVEKVDPPINAFNHQYAQNDIHLFPNPVDNQLTLKNITPGTKIHIVNTSGSVLSQKKAHSDNLTINTEKLIPGRYFLKWQENGNEKVIGFFKI